MRTKLLAILFGVALGTLPLACTAGDDDDASEDTSEAPSTTADERAPSGPAPGVTDDSVTVGVTFVDLSAIGDIVNIDHGDYEAAFRALFDDMNADGGINGRTIEPVIAPVNPVGTEPAEAACLQLTEDADVFIVVGFFLDDAVLCPLETHQTAVIGGTMTPERLERAQAPWYTLESGSDLQSEVVRALAEAGEFDGTLGVYALLGQEAQLNEIVLPLLDDLGVEVAESAVLDAPPDDIAAANAATAVIAERFSASGVDEVLLVGTSGLPWASGTESLDYRPQLLLTDPSSILAYTSDEAGRDLSVLEGAVAGSLYGGPQQVYELPGMQDCIGVLGEAGIEVPEPDAVEDDTYVSAFTACNYVTVLRALLEAAGEDLSYGTLESGADGLEVEIPGDAAPATFGPPPAADGDRPAYLFDWDPSEVDFVVREE
jgi:hypothetical protein